MQLSELWGEDLIRVYVRSSQPLDRGAFSERPRPWREVFRPAPQDGAVWDALRRALDRLSRTSRRDTLAWYFDFLDSLQGGEPSRRKRLRTLMYARTQHVQRLAVNDAAARHRALGRIERRMTEFDRWAWANARGPSLGEETVSSAPYHATMQVFVNTFHLIVAGGGRYVYPNWTLVPGRRPSVPHANRPHFQRAIADAMSAWNALSTRERCSLAYGTEPIRDRELQTLVVAIRTRYDRPAPASGHTAGQEW